MAFEKPANHADLPHQVSVQSTISNHVCSALIIHPLLLLSAASCFRKGATQPPYLVAIAGEHQQPELFKESGQILSATHVFANKEYNITTFDNDIAILVLNQSLQIYDFVSPIQLPDPKWLLTGEKMFELQLNSLRIWY